MSEEEKQAIRIVNDYLLYSNINRTENDEGCELVNLKVPKAMRKVLNLVEKQQKEIEELKSFINLGNLEEMYILLNAKTSECEDIRNERDRALKIRNKIEEKIKELEEIVEFSKKQTENYYDYGAEIDILKELLEGE